MAFLDQNGESEFLFKRDTVFNAVCKAVPKINGMKIDNADKLSGRIMVKAGVTIWSWGENIPIQLISISRTKTKVQITSTPKTGIMFGGAFDMGKNRKNIEKILSETSEVLSTLQPEVQSQEETNTVSVADEIQKLKKLLDDGILTEEEFNRQKVKLLN
ncbi:MAG: SHOCT domain-containing protein [Bacilli bacterium]